VENSERVHLGSQPRLEFVAPPETFASANRGLIADL